MWYLLFRDGSHIVNGTSVKRNRFGAWWETTFLVKSFGLQPGNTYFIYHKHRSFSRNSPLSSVATSRQQLLGFDAFAGRWKFMSLWWYCMYLCNLVHGYLLRDMSISNYDLHFPRGKTHQGHPNPRRLRRSKTLRFGYGPHDKPKSANHIP